MTGSQTSVTDDDLHAYADGFLGATDSTRVEAWLASNPLDAARVDAWKRQNAEIREMFSGYATTRPADLDMVLRRGAKPMRRLRLAAAAVIVFAAGSAVGGYVGPHLFDNRPELRMTAEEILPREAQSAFLVYAGEVRHPVEVFADQEAHLATWLGKRLAIPDLKVPNLQSLGFRLVGGRLLPVNGMSGAMFMFEDIAGKRLTVLVGRNTENRTTSFRLASAGSVETFYWIDGDLGYAVTGEISRDMLRRVAEDCYRQFPS